MNKIEEYKRDKDGLDILDDIPRYANEGWEKITDGDKERLKWAGVFFRRQTPGRFMMRLRIRQRLHDRDAVAHHRRNQPRLRQRFRRYHHAPADPVARVHNQ